MSLERLLDIKEYLGVDYSPLVDFGVWHTATLSTDAMVLIVEEAATLMKGNMSGR